MHKKFTLKKYKKLLLKTIEDLFLKYDSIEFDQKIIRNEYDKTEYGMEILLTFKDYNKMKYESRKNNTIVG